MGGRHTNTIPIYSFKSFDTSIRTFFVCGETEQFWKIDVGHKILRQEKDRFNREFKSREECRDALAVELRRDIAREELSLQEKRDALAKLLAAKETP